MVLRRPLPSDYIPVTSTDALAYAQELASDQHNDDYPTHDHTKPINGLRNGQPASLRQDYFDFD